MDSRNGNAAAAAPLPQYPHPLLALPDLDRPPAVLEMWELEAVAAALPAKKRRLRETFDRLAACAPAPLPFRWEDLDSYISSLQYPVTLRRRQLRELDESRPAPALAPAPAAVPAAPSATGDGVRQVAQPVHAPVPIPPAVSEPAATGGAARKLRALDEPEPANGAPDPAPAQPAVPAPAATALDAEKGKKRKTSSHEADATHAEIRVQEDAAAASPLEEMNCNGKKSRPVPPDPDDSIGLAVEPNATAQVDPVSKIAVVSQELPGPAAARHASNAANRAGRLPLQRMSRRPRPIPASAAASAAPVTGSQEVEAANQKKDDLVVVENASHDGGEANASPCRPGGDGFPITAIKAQVGADPISQITGVRHEPPVLDAASPPMVVASFPLAKVPKQEQQAVEEEVADLEMETVEPEEMQALNDDAPVADEKASPLQVVKPQEADEVSPRPLAACSDL
ncbi:translation initiation factor IF-2-like [Panicum virgatum]|uniref:translation initiation factor IF-2-like n=1 Tax=Panicum virgatum TaxID=38727 RepID=UPI0019D6578F|nr:translation initiation factor IF-2-like [Panicum virgatum]